MLMTEHVFTLTTCSSNCIAIAKQDMNNAALHTNMTLA